MAHLRAAGQTRAVHWGSLSYAFGPVLALAGVGLLIVLLRLAFKPGGSLVQRRVTPASSDDYGMLVPVASPPNYADGEMLRRALEDVSIRATLAFTLDGPRVMVWPADVAIARATLRARRG